MIIKTNDIESTDITGIEKELKAMPEVMAFAVKTGRAGDFIEAIAQHILMTDEDYDTDEQWGIKNG